MDGGLAAPVTVPELESDTALTVEELGVIGEVDMSGNTYQFYRYVEQDPCM